MKSILFVTSNKEKILVARERTAGFELTIDPVMLDLEEIQSDSIEDVARHKAADAFSKLSKPLVVTDHGWSIRALNGFPGPYMRAMNDWFVPDDFLRLMEGQSDRSIQMIDALCFTDGAQTKVFHFIRTGEILHTASGIGLPFQQVASLSGDGKTIGDYLENGTFPPHHDSPWKAFAAWYTAQDDAR